MALSKTTQDHEEIRAWAEERGGKPAEVASTEGSSGPGIIRLEFPGAAHANDSNLKEISWEDFFAKFDESGLALVYQDVTADGEKSNFNKLIHPENASGGAALAKKSASRKKATKASSEKKAAGNSTSQKSATSKSVAKKVSPSAKKSSASKKAPAAVKKADAAKAPARKAAPKSPAKGAVAKKVASKGTPAKKVVGKKASAKKSVSKSTPRR